MTELIAGISGFVFRHEVKHIPALSRHFDTIVLCPDINQISVRFQIKGTFFTTYSEAVMRYDGRDDRSLAVDGVQRRVSITMSSIGSPL